MSYTLHLGDCLTVMATLEANSVDSIVTDPPAGIAFMNKSWDKDKGGRKQWIAWMTEVAAESLRVIRPGGHAFVWALPKTAHWTTTAWEDAGWEIREKFYHLFGSGFPKSRNVSNDLLALPWCACSRVGHIAGTRAELATVASEGDATTDTDVSVALDSGRGDSLPSVEGSALPLQGIGTSVRAGNVPGLARGRATNDAERNGGGLKSGRRTGHRSSTVEGRRENIVGQLTPVMLRSFDVAGMAASNEIADNISGIQDEPEALRDNMMGNQVSGTTAVNTSPIPSDNSLRDVGPSASLIRPLATAPGGIPGSGSATLVVDSHALATAIDRGFDSFSDTLVEGVSAHDAGKGLRAASEFTTSGSLEQNSLGGITASRGAVFGSPIATGELDSAVLASFGKHSPIIRQLVTERKVSVCAECGRPMRPDWVIDGLGTATKPAVEEWILLRKPLSEPNISSNVLAWGTGGINVDKCRIGISPQDDIHAKNPHTQNKAAGWAIGKRHDDLQSYDPTQGRWPANLCLSEDAAVLLDEMSGSLTSGKPNGAKRNVSGTFLAHANGVELTGYGDTGGASRFFKVVNYDKDDLCIPANFANKNLSLLNQHVDFVLGLAAFAVNLEETRSRNMMSRFINEMQNVLRQNGANDTQTMLNIAQKYLQELERMIMEMSSASPVNSAETQRLTSITTIIQSLWNTDGYVANAILPSMPSNLAVGARDLDGQLRFGYHAKSSRRDRDEGLEGMELRKVETMNGYVHPSEGRTADKNGGPKANFHPTVKPTSLMRWLVRLVTPPGGVVLDNFCGSGSTGKAAVLEGFSFVGIDKEAEYLEIARLRIDHAIVQAESQLDPQLPLLEVV